MELLKFMVSPTIRNCKPKTFHFDFPPLSISCRINALSFSKLPNGASTYRYYCFYSLRPASLPADTLNILVSIHEKLNSDKALPKPNWDT